MLRLLSLVLLAPIILSVPLVAITLANPPILDIFIESPAVGEAGRVNVEIEPVVEVNIYKLLAAPGSVVPLVTSIGLILRSTLPVIFDCPKLTVSTAAPTL